MSPLPVRRAAGCSLQREPADVPWHVGLVPLARADGFLVAGGHGAFSTSWRLSLCLQPFGTLVWSERLRYQLCCPGFSLACCLPYTARQQSSRHCLRRMGALSLSLSSLSLSLSLSPQTQTQPHTACAGSGHQPVAPPAPEAAAPAPGHPQERPAERLGEGVPLHHASPPASPHS